MRDNARFEQRQKLLLQVEHHAAYLLPVVVRPDDQIDHERDRQTDERIGKAVEAVHDRVAARIQTHIREHDARERNGEIQPQRDAKRNDAQRSDRHP